MSGNLASDDEVIRLRQKVAELEAELVLRSSEHSFNAAFAEAPIGMALLTCDGMLREVNRAFCEMLGYTEAELTGKTSAPITHPDDVELTKRFFEVLRSGESPRTAIEKRYFHREGHIIWAKASGQLRRDRQGRPMEVVAIVEDITARKLAEAESERLLHEVDRERKRLEAVATQMPLGLIIADAEGKLVFFNAEAERVLGHRVTAGSNYLDYVAHVEQTGVAADQYPIVRSLLRGEVIRDGEIPYRKDDGTLTTLQISSAPIYEEPGKITGAVVIFGDISARKQLERILKESEERLQLIFAQAPVGVCVLRGRELVYELVNPRYQAILPNRELLGRPLLEAVPEASEAILKILYRVLDTGEPFAANEFLLPLDQNRDGVVEDCWFNFVYHPLRDRQDKVTGVVAIALDVSSHVRARVELQRANRELEEVAYVASHDLQEPLRMVNIYTQLLMRELEPVLSETATGFALQVQSGVGRMETLLRDLLTFSRTISEEPREDQPSAVADLNASVRQAVEILQGRIEETGAMVSIEPLPAVFGDQGQLAQVFQNLLSNALKYRKRDGEPVIRIGARQDGVECVIEVGDNGIGFAQAQAERIFGLFKRLHKDEYQGTGLGLAICKRIVERHGGRIWAESEPGKGSRFFVALKAATYEALQVLLAEDNAGDVFLVEEALRAHSMNCVLRVVRDGDEAEEYLGRVGTVPEVPCPDVFLLDLNLPSGDGHELLEKFRAHPQCTAVPVVVVTSSDAPRDRARAERSGADAYFRKPSNLNEFMELGAVVARVVKARGE